MVVIGACVFELHLPGARSLKEKRRVVKGMIESLNRKHRISIAETDLHDVHQRAEIALAVVGYAESQVRRLLDSLRDCVELEHDAVLTSWTTDFIDLAE